MCDIKIDDPFQCRGHTSIPDTLEEFLEKRVEDDWNTNIKCVMLGAKHVAVTDYDSLENPEEVENYYEQLGGLPEHIDLLERAKECGIKVMFDIDGTHLYYKENAKVNAELLMKYGFISSPEELPEDINREIFRSLLMGYTDLSIILYQLINDNDQNDMLTDENYMDMVDEYIEGYTIEIERVREFLESHSALLFED